MCKGVLVIDKPSGWTSFQIVRAVRKKFRIKKVGHTGTLDPLATGVLPICLGSATKIAQFIMVGHKVYQGTMLLGVTTDTYDADGKIIGQMPLPSDLDLVSIRKVAQEFTGRLLQAPPPFSAAKHQGRPLYKFARQGIMIQKAPRPVDVFSFEILGIRLPEVDFRIECSKGTYVRSLAYELGKRLGCGAHLVALRRTQSGPFNIKQAVGLDTLGRYPEDSMVSDVIIPIDKALSHIPAVQIDRETAEGLRSGCPIPIDRVRKFLRQQGIKSDHRDLPYLRLLLCRHGAIDLVSIVAWPVGKRTDHGQEILRTIKVWH
ncbi:MAG: tRNA pseudouridine(55) synthase TruB [Nitrospiraceae bacterium]|nr:tRNA pseudouridine(55) synthase TruB [Nitrospiraceae bacterium]